MNPKTIAILDTMWGGSGNAPGLFRVNPLNLSGKRLYSWLGHSRLLVTNACAEIVANPNLHGIPNPALLAKNLQRISIDLLLVCGKVAVDTFLKCGYCPKCRVVFTPHPAARTWTKAALLETQCIVQGNGNWSLTLNKGVLTKTNLNLVHTKELP